MSSGLSNSTSSHLTRTGGRQYAGWEGAASQRLPSSLHIVRWQRALD